jgi:hypothetical protein
VKFMNKKLERMSVGETFASAADRRVFTHIWRSPAPSKVIAFSWKLLHNRIPTRVNLRHRNVLPLEMSVSCALCEGNPETSNHLFIHCVFARDVWRGVCRWLEVVLDSPHNVFLLWESWNEMVVNIKIRKFGMLWCGVYGVCAMIESLTMQSVVWRRWWRR